MTKRIIGIDLGTSNCVVAYAAVPAEDAKLDINLLPIPQVTDAGSVELGRTLPSFLYIPNAHELADGALALPWNEQPEFAVGSFARNHGAKVPDRLVSSAKSWLCHTGIDRMSPVLPIGRDASIPGISPVDASARYLTHLREAFDQALGAETGADLDQQEVVLTVPASFDPSARDLTIEAARRAGLTNVVLLEEPQAALYSWIDALGDGWRKELSVGDVVLVCDIGGGTTDFSLIAIKEIGGELALERIAVGEHILLGGDNMDFALAFALRKELEEAGTKLSNWQLTALVQGARAAKELLLSNADVEVAPIVIPSRGSSFLKKNIKTELTRQKVIDIVAEGFFPQCAVSERPQPARRTGLTQLGLPYASDAAITRHLANFLTRNATDGTFVKPTALLFNGGVVQADPLRNRLVTVINSWLSTANSDPITVLDGVELDAAVARGATYYGHARAGRGIRIRGGTARSYYVGVEQSMPAVPGYEPPIMAVCVAPFGMEEGTHAELEGHDFGLVTGEPARVRFFASSVRKEDAVGDVLEDWDDETLTELPEIETTLNGMGDE
ncbi:MAG: hypothetical protein ACI9OJ_002195, partial [Myxococcota bacterium]